MIYGNRLSFVYFRSCNPIPYVKENKELIIFDLLKRKNVVTRAIKRMRISNSQGIEFRKSFKKRLGEVFENKFGGDISQDELKKYLEK